MPLPKHPPWSPGAQTQATEALDILKRLAPHEKQATGLQVGSEPEERCLWLSPPAAAWQVTRTCLAHSVLGCALCGEVFLICPHCHSLALWGIVAFLGGWAESLWGLKELLCLMTDKGY